LTSVKLQGNSYRMN